MVHITLPDGSQREYPGPATLAEVAQSIGTGLAKAALGGKVDGKLVDTSFVIDHDAPLSIVTAPKRIPGAALCDRSRPHSLSKGTIMKTFKLVALSAALCFGMATAATAADMSRTDYKAAKDAISAKYKADKAACKSMSGNAEDICKEEAEGREEVAKAELEAQYKPSAEAQYDVRMARAEAAYDVAKEKCDDFAGNAKDVCVKEADAAFVTAKEDAKVAEKTAEAKAVANEKTRAASGRAGSFPRRIARRGQGRVPPCSAHLPGPVGRKTGRG